MLLQKSCKGSSKLGVGHISGIGIDIGLLVLLWNVLTFGLMMVDKNQARKHGQRISERTLFLCAFCFGAIGIWSGMYRFRHKTKHRSFVIGIPFLFILNLFAYYYFRWQ
ncbi:DUF1294 domain-containing protein [Sporomusa sp.]|uniref:DUF1294 domain-containing protein n=1 Tax=Sporomusa sp. TaxID=2078658 RepID=UPI0039C8E3C5